MGSLLYIVTKDTIYRGFYKAIYDEMVFRLFFQTLNGISKESTFDALKSKLHYVMWKQTYDTVNPYGDRRHVHYETVWTFNLDTDILLFTKRYNSGHLSLSVLRQRLVCIPLIREHLAIQKDQGCESGTTPYLILSVRCVILCRVLGDKLECTRPEPFLNGITTDLGHCTYSDRVLDLLLSATSTDPPDTPIHSLPIELQNRVLMYTSQGPVEPARMGCALGLGSPFLWKDGKMAIYTEHARRTRFEDSPVLSQICLDDHMIGVSYKGDNT